MKFNGINHLAMATGGMEATIRFWRDLLGMRLVAGLGAPGYRHYFFESWSVTGADVRRQPAMGDRQPTMLAREGAEPQPGRWPPVTRPTPPAQRRVYPGAGSELFHGKRAP